MRCVVLKPMGEERLAIFRIDNGFRRIASQPASSSHRPGQCRNGCRCNFGLPSCTFDIHTLVACPRLSDLSRLSRLRCDSWPLTNRFLRLPSLRGWWLAWLSTRPGTPRARSKSRRWSSIPRAEDESKRRLEVVLHGTWFARMPFCWCAQFWIQLGPCRWRETNFCVCRGEGEFVEMGRTLQLCSQQ